MRSDQLSEQVKTLRQSQYLANTQRHSTILSFDLSGRYKSGGTRQPGLQALDLAGT